MRDRIEQALKGCQADYAEIRIEQSENTSISYRGKQQDSLSRTSGIGGSVRAAVNGGWGFASFNDLDRLKENVDMAVRQARLVGRDKTVLADVEPVVDSLRPELVKDPRSVSLAEKKRLAEEYLEVIYSLGERIQTTTIFYGDSARSSFYANTEGSYIDSESIYIAGSVQAVAKKDSIIQPNASSFSSTIDFGVFENRHEKVRAMAQAAVEMLDAENVDSGTYTVVVDPQLAGVFAHEAFGHLSEADDYAENPHLRELMTLGRRFGGKQLNIIDGADIPGSGGSIVYDQEGVRKTPTYLIREGELVGRLHSRESAGKMGEVPTGNARAIGYSYAPIVRMTNTYIAAGDSTLEEMLSDVNDGIYVVDSMGGQTSGEMFTFSAREAYKIRNGSIAERVRGVNLTGNVFTTLENIDLIGNDITWPNRGGGCGKGGQSPLPVGFAGPHFRISKCVVGGK